MVNKSNVALFFGTVAAFVHLVWAALVASGYAQAYIDFVMGMHFMSSTMTVKSFDALHALYLVVLAFVVGNVVGYILATLWNEIVAKKK